MTWLQQALLKAAKEADSLKSWQLKIEESVKLGRVINQEPQKLDYELIKGKSQE